MSTTSQPVQNPIYTGIPSNINNNNRRFSSVDTVPNSHLKPTSIGQMNTNESNVQMRNNVRDYRFIET
jgi:hypothetical protein